MGIISILTSKKAVKELTEKYESEFKRITGRTTAELKYPIIPDFEMFEEVKKLRADIYAEAERRGVSASFNWLK